MQPHRGGAAVIATLPDGQVAFGDPARHTKSNGEKLLATKLGVGPLHSSAERRRASGEPIVQEVSDEFLLAAAAAAVRLEVLPAGATLRAVTAEDLAVGCREFAKLMAGRGFAARRLGGAVVLLVAVGGLPPAYGTVANTPVLLGVTPHPLGSKKPEDWGAWSRTGGSSRRALDSRTTKDWLAALTKVHQACGRLGLACTRGKVMVRSGLFVINI